MKIQLVQGRGGVAQTALLSHKARFPFIRKAGQKLRCPEHHVEVSGYLNSSVTSPPYGGSTSLHLDDGSVCYTVALTMTEEKIFTAIVENQIHLLAHHKNL
jgi:hypothetical protein